MSLPGMGRISYGSVTWGATSRSHITSTPIWDDAKRTIVSVRHEVAVRGYVNGSGTGASNTDDTMAILHAQLETPGLELIYDENADGSGGMGWGHLHVNGSGPAKDTSWGPHPVLVSFTPLGGGATVGCVTALVEWRCTTTLPSCIGGAAYEKQLMAFNYGWDHAIDGNGLSRISITGYIEIPCTRVANSRKIPDHADKYREKLQELPELQGFRRENKSFRLSMDRRRLDFSWTDQEIPFPLPNGCSYADVQHGTSWQISNAAIMRQSLAGSIAVAPKKAMETAVEKWLIIVASRINIAKAEGAKLLFVDGNKEQTVIITSTSFREEVFGRTVHFQTDYSIIGAPLQKLMRVSGLFRAIPGTDFKEWRTSLKDSVFAIRGAADVRWNGDMDAIVDLCDRGSNGKSKVSTLRTKGISELKTIEKLPAAKPNQMKAVQIFGFNANRNAVDPDASWIYYDCRLVLDEDDRLAIHKPIGGDAKENMKPSQNEPSAAGQSGTFPPGTFGPDATHSNYVGGNEEVIQRVTGPVVRVKLVGRAIRLAHRIPTPALKTVGGRQATQADQHSEEWTLSVVGGVPIFAKTWVVSYVVTLPPSGPMLVPANPALQTGVYEAA